MLLFASLAALALAQPLPSADFGRSEADVAPGLALIGTVLGLFLVMFLIASAVSAWCPSCHSFGMREAGRTVDGYRDHSADPFSTNLRADVSYRYVCSKCGHRKVDRYSGFWDRNRAR